MPETNNKNLIPIITGISLLILLVVLLVIINKNYQIQLNPRSALSEAEAQSIAEKFCVKGGEVLSAGSYNQKTKTWWFDANLNTVRDGCNPACVVSEDSKTAEINWRCTGLKDPQNNIGAKQCGMENCHGLDIVCGPNPVEMCDMMYQVGDKCRQFAECKAINGSCRLIDNPLFTACKECAKKCEKNFQGDPEKVLSCESECGE